MALSTGTQEVQKERGGEDISALWARICSCGEIKQSTSWIFEELP